MPIDGLEEVLLEWSRDVHDAAIERVIDDLQERCPVGESGDLLQSFYGPDTFEDAFGVSSTVGFDADYASYTDEGAAAHGIDPVNASILKFDWPNGPDGPGTYYFPHVDHPGQEGTNWFTGTVEAWDEYIQDAIEGG